MFAFLGVTWFFRPELNGRSIISCGLIGEKQNKGFERKFIQTLRFDRLFRAVFSVFLPKFWRNLAHSALTFLVGALPQRAAKLAAPHSTHPSRPISEEKIDHRTPSLGALQMD